MDPVLRAVEAQYAALSGLSSEEMETLRELVPFVSPRVEQRDAPSVEEKEGVFYRLRYEAAEARYGRMKALVCASLEAQMRLKSRVSGHLVVETLRDLGLGDTAAVDAILQQKTIDESQRRQMVDEIYRMVCHLRPAARGSSSLPVDAMELEIARRKIFALELELNRFNDKAFEDDERLREWEDVFHKFKACYPTSDSVSMVVPTQFHPMITCNNAHCQSFIRRLCSGFKQALAEAYVRDRNARIHGHFRQHVEPLERLRLQKDREIDRLRFDLARLERATGRMSSDVTLDQLDTAIVCRKLELDSLGAQALQMREQIRNLACERDRWNEALVERQQALREADARIEEGRNMHALLELQIQVFETRKKELQQVESARRAEEDLQQRTQQATMMETCDYVEGEQQHHGGEKRAATVAQPSYYLMRSGKPTVCRQNGAIYVLCRCNEAVPRSSLANHVAEAHGDGALLCPNGCGFFIPKSRPGRQTDMSRHIKGMACAERMQEIRRLEEG